MIIANQPAQVNVEIVAFTFSESIYNNSQINPSYTYQLQPQSYDINKILNDYDTFISKATSAIINFNIPIAYKIFGFNDEAKEQLVNLLSDKTINNDIKNYIREQKPSSLKEFIKNTNTQNYLFNYLTYKTNCKKYNKLHKIIKIDIVRKELIKSMTNC
ncbi:MAG: hypothetical protein LKG27_05470 [Clostridiaceae bacterium]|jgi:hypothetical protein|nr:hypothetical protein [Clostridiaceae bacterium]